MGNGEVGCLWSLFMYPEREGSGDKTTSLKIVLHKSRIATHMSGPSLAPISFLFLGLSLRLSLPLYLILLLILSLSLSHLLQGKRVWQPLAKSLVQLTTFRGISMHQSGGSISTIIWLTNCSNVTVPLLAALLTKQIRDLFKHRCVSTCTHESRPSQANSPKSPDPFPLQRVGSGD